MNIIEIDLDKLRNHPLNAKVFGELKCDADADTFTASIREHGIQNPIAVGPEGEDGSYVILAGHRRRQAAAKCGHKSAPCYVREDADSPEMVDLIWSEMGLQREMTVEQRARYYIEREEIEARLAKQRQVSGRPSEKLSEGGEAKVKAAKAAKMSKPTAEKAAKVVKKIDELEAAGDVERAEQIRTTLNTKSVEAAHKQAAPETSADIVRDTLDRDVPARLRVAYTNGQRIQSIGRKLDTITRELKEVAAEPGGEVLTEIVSRVEGVLKTLKHDLNDTAYWTACPKCGGSACKRCENRGWLAVDDAGTVTADEKKQLGVK